MARMPQPTVKRIAQATRKRFFNDHSMMRLIMGESSKFQVPSSKETPSTNVQSLRSAPGHDWGLELGDYLVFAVWSLELSLDLASAVEHLGAEVGIANGRLELNPFRGARRAGKGVLRHRAAEDFQGLERRLLSPQRLGKFNDRFAQWVEAFASRLQIRARRKVGRGFQLLNGRAPWAVVGKRVNQSRNRGMSL